METESEPTQAPTEGETPATKPTPKPKAAASKGKAPTLETLSARVAALELQLFGAPKE